MTLSMGVPTVARSNRRYPTRSIPWYAPQTTNVQLAPCHSPTSTITTIMLRYKTKDHLLQQTRQDEYNTALNYNCRGTPPVLDLRNKLPGANDWTRNKMREKCNEQRVVDRVSDSLHFPPIDIEGIRKTGERVKADS